MASDATILCCAPNGARRGTGDHPALPVTSAQMAETAKRCLDAGAAMLHCHARDGAGRHSLDPELNRSWLEAVQRAVGDRLILQLTTEAAGIYGRRQQLELLRALRPESFSAAVRELCPDATAEEEYAGVLAALRADGVRMQHIVYSPEELARFVGLHEAGVVPEQRPLLLFVLGRYSGAAGRARDLPAFLQVLGGRDWPWMVCAFGAEEATSAVAAAALGGHARIGFENNLQAAGGRVYADNAESVGMVRRLFEGMGRPVADVGAARALLR